MTPTLARRSQGNAGGGGDGGGGGGGDSGGGSGSDGGGGSGDGRDTRDEGWKGARERESERERAWCGRGLRVVLLLAYVRYACASVDQVGGRREGRKGSRAVGWFRRLADGGGPGERW